MREGEWGSGRRQAREGGVDRDEWEREREEGGMDRERGREINFLIFSIIHIFTYF